MEVKVLDKAILMTCKELVDNAKLGCADMVFKDLCIELLAKAKLILTESQFQDFNNYVSEKLREKTILNPTQHTH